MCLEAAAMRQTSVLFSGVLTLTSASAVIVATMPVADRLTCDLTHYNPAPGLTAIVERDLLVISSAGPDSRATRRATSRRRARERRRRIPRRSARRRDGPRDLARAWAPDSSPRPPIGR